MYIKKMKLTAMIIAILLMFSAFTACSGSSGNNGGSGGSGNSKMTEITVMNLDAGVGDEWVNNAAKRFADYYKGYSFGEGKTGVKVSVKNELKNGQDLIGQIKSDKKYNVYLTEQVYYRDFVNANLLADITDVVTENLTSFGETRSIADKMDSNMRNYLNVNGKYYAVPFYEGYTGIMYDVDLFEQKGFYLLTDGTFAQRGKFNNGKYTGAGTLANGPDGKPNTYDDGLPATYDDFFKLCYYMRHDNGVVPLIWPGGYQVYVNEFAMGLLSDYEGYDRMLLNYTFDGEDDSLVSSVSNNGNISFSSKTQITSSNKEILSKQAGRYYALDFISKIMDQVGYYTVDNVMSPAMTHYDCNDLFLMGRFSSSSSNPTIAMMIEGTWWQNEAKGTFEDMEMVYGSAASKANRRIGMMPYPKATADKVGEGVTVTSLKDSFAFVNGNITDPDVLKASKMFLQFCCTNDSLVKFQQTAGISWELDYTMTEAELAECSYYVRSIYNIHKGEKSVVHPYATNDVFLKNVSKIMYGGTFWTTKVGGKDYNIITSTFYDAPGTTSKIYFDGLVPIAYA